MQKRILCAFASDSCKTIVSRVESLNLFLSLLISTVGFVYFLYGRKRSSSPFMLTGLVLMGFSYFLESFWLSLLIGTVLIAVPFFVHEK
jgi:hypothetical protein